MSGKYSSQVSKAWFQATHGEKQFYPWEVSVFQITLNTPHYWLECLLHIININTRNLHLICIEYIFESIGLLSLWPYFLYALASKFYLFYDSNLLHSLLFHYPSPCILSYPKFDSFQFHLNFLILFNIVLSLLFANLAHKYFFQSDMIFWLYIFKKISLMWISCGY
jgi:hypothetical protein